MIPSPIYCRRCGGFTGKHKMTKTGKNAHGEHENLEDCVSRLYEAIKQLGTQMSEYRHDDYL